VNDKLLIQILIQPQSRVRAALFGQESLTERWYV